MHYMLHYQQQKLNFNRDGLKPYFSTYFDAFYFSHFVTRWRYFRSSIYCANSPSSPPRVCLFMNTKSRDQTNGEIYTAKTKAFKCATQATCISKGASAGTLLIASSPP